MLQMSKPQSLYSYKPPHAARRFSKTQQPPLAPPGEKSQRLFAIISLRFACLQASAIARAQHVRVTTLQSLNPSIPVRASSLTSRSYPRPPQKPSRCATPSPYRLFAWETASKAQAARRLASSSRWRRPPSLLRRTSDARRLRERGESNARARFFHSLPYSNVSQFHVTVAI